MLHYFFVMLPLETTAVDSESNIQDVFKVQNSDIHIWCILYFFLFYYKYYICLWDVQIIPSVGFLIFFCFLFLHSFKELSLQLTNHSAASSSNAGHHWDPIFYLKITHTKGEYYIKTCGCFQNRFESLFLGKQNLWCVIAGLYWRRHHTHQNTAKQN